MRPKQEQYTLIIDSLRNFGPQTLDELAERLENLMPYGSCRFRLYELLSWNRVIKTGKRLSENGVKASVFEESMLTQEHLPIGTKFRKVPKVSLADAEFLIKYIELDKDPNHVRDQLALLIEHLKYTKKPILG